MRLTASYSTVRVAMEDKKPAIFDTEEEARAHVAEKWGKNPDDYHYSKGPMGILITKKGPPKGWRKKWGPPPT